MALLSPPPRQDKDINSHSWQEWFYRIWKLATSSTSKAGTTTRDLTAASGSVTITGCPFIPTRVFIKAAINGSRQYSDGFSDGSSGYCYKFDYTATADGISTSFPVYIRTAVGDSQTATVTLTNDGFTLAWVKTGTPTGTATIIYMMEA